MKKYIKLNDKTLGEVEKTIKKLNSNKKFIDIIFTVDKTFEKNRSHITMEKFIYEYGDYIIERKNDINYGGGLIKNKKTVRNPINKTTKSINKRKGVYKRTNKTKK